MLSDIPHSAAGWSLRGKPDKIARFPQTGPPFSRL